MKLVREHINEKFTDESDPIKDLGIGIVKPDTMLYIPFGWELNIYNYFYKRWKTGENRGSIYRVTKAKFIATNTILATIVEDYGKGSRLTGTYEDIYFTLKQFIMFVKKYKQLNAHS